MTLDMIREFIELSNIGNYEEAAFHLFTTQSTLSKHIQSLELELGAPLFRRGRGGIELTNFGRKYLFFARQIVQLHTDFLTDSSIRKNDESCLRIGYPPHMDAYGFFEQIKSFCDLYPQYTLFLEDEQVFDKLHTGEIDLAILFEDPKSRDKTVAMLRQDYLVPVVSAEHPLGASVQISISSLAHEPFISLPSGMFLETCCDQLCRLAGFDPNIVFYISAPDGRHMIDLVRQNVGVALLPRQEALYWSAPDLIVGEPDLKYMLNICIQAGNARPLSRAERDFVDYMCSGEET